MLEQQELQRQRDQLAGKSGTNRASCKRQLWTLLQRCTWKRSVPVCDVVITLAVHLFGAGLHLQQLQQQGPCRTLADL
jgi:hypothetical protein